MVWNKTPQETVEKVLKSLEDHNKTYDQIASEVEISAYTVGRICRDFLSTKEKKARYSIACSRGKQGIKNPMFGKKGYLHPNSSREVVRVSGYKTVFKPEWWEGKTILSGRIYEHHFIWAQRDSQKFLPKGCVVHHIDLNIDNNSPENLILLSISDHMKLHAEIRKVQRLSRKGVENSVLEAQGNSYELVI